MKHEKSLLSLIWGLFVVLGITYAITTPVFEASDELWHYPMIQHLANGNSLPVQVFDPAEAGLWKQEASQPPLYYYLGAALTFWIDTSDMEQVRWLNPHVDNGVLTPDGNRNLAIHDPAASQWQGTLLAVHIVRIASVFLGALTVFLTYLIAKETIPNRPEIALGAAAFNAFMPMFIFISGAVNNDNLALPLASLAVLLMIRAVTQPVNSGQTIRKWLLLGVVIGLAILTKEGTFGLLPLAWGTIFIAQWQQISGKSSIPNPQTQIFKDLLQALGKSLAYFALMLIPVVAIAGWWYWRNLQLYGDWLGWSAFIAVLGERAQPASLAQLWDERVGFMMSYWGLFGGVNVAMASWIYAVLNTTLVVSMVGFVVFALQKIKGLGLKIKATGINLQSFIITLLDFVIENFGLVVCLLFSGAVVYGLIQWATTTWSSQGRLVFTAISTLNVLFAIGLVGWLKNKRLARWTIGILAGFMLAIAVSTPFIWVQPAYRPETYAMPRTYIPRQVRINDTEMADFGGIIRLVDVAIEPTELGTLTIQPGDYVDIRLTWETLAPLDRNWSVFVHLNDPVLGVPIAQRDMYTGQGLRPTSLLQVGEMIENYYRLSVPTTAVAPAQLAVTVGLYDFETGERLKLPNGQDAITLGILTLKNKEGEYPNATAVNFGNEIALVGYELSPRRTEAGNTVDLVLYWEAQRPLTENYTFFAQVVGEDTTRWGSNDLAPPEGTFTWQPDEVYEVHMPITLPPDTPPDVYPIHLGAYTRTDDGGFQRLQLVTEDGRITQNDFLLLTKIRVD